MSAVFNFFFPSNEELDKDINNSQDDHSELNSIPEIPEDEHAEIDHIPEIQEVSPNNKRSVREFILSDEDGSCLFCELGSQQCLLCDLESKTEMQYREHLLASNVITRRKYDAVVTKIRSSLPIILTNLAFMVSIDTLKRKSFTHTRASLDKGANTKECNEILNKNPFLAEILKKFGYIAVNYINNTINGDPVLYTDYLVDKVLTLAVEGGFGYIKQCDEQIRVFRETMHAELQKKAALSQELD